MGIFIFYSEEADDDELRTLKDIVGFLLPRVSRE